MKLDLNEIRIIDIELTNKCNAACPGCNRENHKPHTLNTTEWSLQDIKRIIPKQVLHPGVEFFFGGTVDEAMMNTQVYEICEYILSFGCNIVLETNGGANTAKTFTKLGKLSKHHDHRLTVRFSVDGVEKNNHLYRVNVKWKTVMRNMKAYINAGGDGLWQYLVFDHNYQDIEEAFEISKDVNIPFQLRQGTRGIEPFISLIQTKNKETKKIETEKFVVEQSKKFTHDYMEERKALQEQEELAPEGINCYMLHKKNIFLDAQFKLWPCCWWASDSYINGERAYFDKLAQEYGRQWNNLKYKSMKSILNHRFYSEILHKSFVDENYKDKFRNKCQVECGDGGHRNRTKRVDLSDDK